MVQRNPWSALAVLALAQFMVVLDVTIVNVALPDIQQDLGFTASGLQWVVSGYTLLFGGFLLLGGRTADLLGRRRMFLAGLLLFGVTSLLAGLAQNPEQLIVLRALQGLAGALLSPAAFAILTVTYRQGRDRNIAMGVWGGLAGLGGTLGVIAGGFLVDSLTWRWIFLVNVPIALALAAVLPMFIPESRAATEGRRTFDVAGAVLSTAGLLAIVLGVIRAEALGWSSFQVIALLAGGVALLAAFVRVEARSTAPLVPLALFRSRGLTTSVLALALNGGAFLGMFFLTAIFMQQVRGLTALETGLQFLPMGVAAIASAVVASQLVTRYGTKPVQFGGAAVSVVGLLLLTQADATSSYATSMLPGIVLFGIGIIAVGTPASISAVADVRNDQAGAASGVVNAGYQVGGALGLAVITTLATSHVEGLVSGGAGPQEALVDGFQRGLLIAAVLAAANLVMAVSAPRLRPTADQLAEAPVAA